MIRLVVAGTSDFGLPTFAAIVRDPAVTLVGIVSQPAKPVGRRQILTPSPVARWAIQQAAPVLTPKNWRDEAALATLKSWRPDIVLVASYGLIVPTTVLTIPTKACLNIHASLLPAYRGASPIAAAILNGDTTTGVTLMVMEAGLDTGPMLAQWTCAIAPDDTAPRLTERLADLAAQHVSPALQQYLAGVLIPRPQPTESTYAPKITRADGQADWSSAATLERKIRAYDPWPGVWTTWGASVIKFLSGAVVPGQPDGKIGTVVPHQAGWAVVCADGLFVPRMVQFSGKKPQAATTIPGGYPGFLGAQLGA